MEEELIKHCFEGKEKSYSPYSKFRVGACLKTTTGKYFKGSNIENSSYGLTICAERTAMVKAVSEGERHFTSIAITTDVLDQFITPCGACRQFLAEFGDMDVYLVKPDRSFKKLRLSELLPFSFTPEDLQLDRSSGSSKDQGLHSHKDDHDDYHKQKLK